MGGKYGVSALLDGVGFLISAGAIGKDVLADGKIGILELVKFAPLIPKVIRLVGEVPMMPQELAENDEDQAAFLSGVAAMLPQIIDSARVRDLANLYLKALVALVNAISTTFGMQADAKETPVAAI